VPVIVADPFFHHFKAGVRPLEELGKVMTGKNQHAG